jgi:hypothetical protein
MLHPLKTLPRKAAQRTDVLALHSKTEGFPMRAI